MSKLLGSGVKVVRREQKNTKLGDAVRESVRSRRSGRKRTKTIEQKDFAEIEARLAEEARKAIREAGTTRSAREQRQVQQTQDRLRAFRADTSAHVASNAFARQKNKRILEKAKEKLAEYKEKVEGYKEDVKSYIESKDIKSAGELFKSLNTKEDTEKYDFKDIDFPMTHTSENEKKIREEKEKKEKRKELEKIREGVRNKKEIKEGAYSTFQQTTTQTPQYFQEFDFKEKMPSVNFNIVEVETPDGFTQPLVLNHQEKKAYFVVEPDISSTKAVLNHWVENPDEYLKNQDLIEASNYWKMDLKVMKDWEKKAYQEIYFNGKTTDVNIVKLLSSNKHIEKLTKAGYIEELPDIGYREAMKEVGKALITPEALALQAGYMGSMAALDYTTDKFLGYGLGDAADSALAAKDVMIALTNPNPYNLAIATYEAVDFAENFIQYGTLHFNVRAALYAGRLGYRVRPFKAQNVIGGHILKFDDTISISGSTVESQIINRIAKGLKRGKPLQIAIYEKPSKISGMPITYVSSYADGTIIRRVSHNGAVVRVQNINKDGTGYEATIVEGNLIHEKDLKLSGKEVTGHFKFIEKNKENFEKKYKLHDRESIVYGRKRTGRVKVKLPLTKKKSLEGWAPATEIESTTLTKKGKKKIGFKTFIEKLEKDGTINANTKRELLWNYHTLDGIKVSKKPAPFRNMIRGGYLITESKGKRTAVVYQPNIERDTSYRLNFKGKMLEVKDSKITRKQWNEREKLAALTRDKFKSGFFIKGKKGSIAIVPQFGTNLRGTSDIEDNVRTPSKAKSIEASNQLDGKERLSGEYKSKFNELKLNFQKDGLNIKPLDQQEFKIGETSLGRTRTHFKGGYLSSGKSKTGKDTGSKPEIGFDYQADANPDAITNAEYEAAVNASNYINAMARGKTGTALNPNFNINANLNAIVKARVKLKPDKDDKGKSKKRKGKKKKQNIYRVKDPWAFWEGKSRYSQKGNELLMKRYGTWYV